MLREEHKAIKALTQRSLKIVHDLMRDMVSYVEPPVGKVAGRSPSTTSQNYWDFPQSIVKTTKKQNG